MLVSRWICESVPERPREPCPTGASRFEPKRGGSTRHLVPHHLWRESGGVKGTTGLLAINPVDVSNLAKAGTFGRSEKA